MDCSSAAPPGSGDRLAGAAGRRAGVRAWSGRAGCRRRSPPCPAAGVAVRRRPGAAGGGRATSCASWARRSGSWPRSCCSAGWPRSRACSRSLGGARGPAARAARPAARPRLRSPRRSPRRCSAWTRRSCCSPRSCFATGRLLRRAGPPTRRTPARTWPTRRSLLLPVSNLTNLLAFGASGLTFLGFAALMALPWLAVLGDRVRWCSGSVRRRPAGRRAGRRRRRAGRPRRGSRWPCWR